LGPGRRGKPGFKKSRYTNQDAESRLAAEVLETPNAKFRGQTLGRNNPVKKLIRQHVENGKEKREEGAMGGMGNTNRRIVMIGTEHKRLVGTLRRGKRQTVRETTKKNKLHASGGLKFGEFRWRKICIIRTVWIAKRDSKQPAVRSEDRQPAAITVS